MRSIPLVTTDTHIVTELRKQPASKRNELLRSAAQKADVRIGGAHLFNTMKGSFEIHAQLPTGTAMTHENAQATFFRELKPLLQPKPGWMLR